MSVKMFAVPGIDKPLSASDALDILVRRYMKEHPGQTYSQGVAACLAADDNLREEYGRPQVSKMSTGDEVAEEVRRYRQKYPNMSYSEAQEMVFLGRPELRVRYRAELDKATGRPSQ